MISKELQKNIKTYIANKTRDDSWCKSQSKSIILRDSTSIEAFEQAYPRFVCYRSDSDIEKRKYIDSKTEELWNVVVANKNSIGRRYYKAIIDSSIDEDIYRIIVNPCLANYCCSVEFF